MNSKCFSLFLLFLQSNKQTNNFPKCRLHFLHASEVVYVRTSTYMYMYVTNTKNVLIVCRNWLPRKGEKQGWLWPRVCHQLSGPLSTDLFAGRQNESVSPGSSGQCDVSQSAFNHTRPRFPPTRKAWTDLFLKLWVLLVYYLPYSYTNRLKHIPETCHHVFVYAGFKIWIWIVSEIVGLWL